MFMDYNVKDNQLVITIDLKEEEFVSLKKSSTGKSYNVLSERITFDYKGYPIKGNLNLYISKDDYEEILHTKKLAAMEQAKPKSNKSNSSANDIDARISNLESAVSQLTSGLNQLIAALSNSKK